MEEKMISAGKKIDPSANRAIFRQVLCGGMSVSQKKWNDGKPADPEAKKYVNKTCLDKVAKAYDRYAKGLSSDQKIIYDHFITGMIGKIYLEVNGAVSEKFGGKAQPSSASETNKKVLEYTREINPKRIRCEIPFTEQAQEVSLLKGGLEFARHMAVSLRYNESANKTKDNSKDSLVVYDTDPLLILGF